MTLLPLEDWNVKGAPGVRYKVPSVCSVPGCSRFADHAHHLWRRSYLGGDFWWVTIPDVGIVGNVVPLCWRHHDDVTGGKDGHKAKIQWADQPAPRGLYWVRLEGEGPREAMALSWQPPTMDDPSCDMSHGFVGPASTARCTGCGRPLKREDDGQKRDPKRRRKSWLIQVPDDTSEDGAKVLDLLLENVAEIFGHDPHAPNLRYFTVVQALALVVQHKEMMLNE